MRMFWRKKKQPVVDIVESKSEEPPKKKISIEESLTFKGTTWIPNKVPTKILRDNHNEVVFEKRATADGTVYSGYIIAYVNGEPLEPKWFAYDNWGVSKNKIEEEIDGIRRERNGTAYTGTE